MTSSFEGHTEVVRVLIGAKAEVNAQEEVCYSSTTTIPHKTIQQHTVSG